MHKVFLHMGELLYEKVDGDVSNPDVTSQKYKVTGVRSFCGEITEIESVEYESGAISLWLSKLQTCISNNIQEKLHMALGYERRSAQIEQTVKSAGASRIRISRPSSAVKRESRPSSANQNESRMSSASSSRKLSRRDTENKLSKCVSASLRQ